MTPAAAPENIRRKGAESQSKNQTRAAPSTVPSRGNPRPQIKQNSTVQHSFPFHNMTPGKKGDFPVELTQQKRYNMEKQRRGN
jgi:hypothetical protein